MKNITPNGYSAKEEKKVANKLYKTIIVMVIIAALGLIAYGSFNKDIKSPVQNPTTESAFPDTNR